MFREHLLMVTDDFDPASGLLSYTSDLDNVQLKILLKAPAAQAPEISFDQEADEAYRRGCDYYAMHKEQPAAYLRLAHECFEHAATRGHKLAILALKIYSKSFENLDWL